MYIDQGIKRRILKSCVKVVNNKTGNLERQILCAVYRKSKDCEGSLQDSGQYGKNINLYNKSNMYSEMQGRI